ncbi:MAG: hypothetical protein ACRD59_12635, partial [Candidatus Acidiferrales bacterium]
MMGRTFVPSIAAFAVLLGSGSARKQDNTRPVPGAAVAHSLQPDSTPEVPESAVLAATAAQQASATPAPAPQPKQVDVPANATLTVRMVEGVDSSKNNAGEIFHASLESPVMVDNEVVVPK